MKIAVIVADANGAIHAGLDVERNVRTFDLPDEIAEHIKAKTAPYVSISFALVEELKGEAT